MFMPNIKDIIISAWTCCKLKIIIANIAREAIGTAITGIRSIGEEI
jgi:hypothetical protein